MKNSIEFEIFPNNSLVWNDQKSYNADAMTINKAAHKIIINYKIQIEYIRKEIEREREMKYKIKWILYK